MLGEPKNQFSLTRAALSTRGAQKQILISRLPNNLESMSLAVSEILKTFAIQLGPIDNICYRPIHDRH